MNRFAIIGVGGFVAPRHLKAIKETGSELVASLDPNDSVGIIDSYFPNSDFFTEFERFDRHIDKLRRSGNPVDYVSICSPNYLHDAHIRFALRNNADAICEKPLVLNPWNVEALKEIEVESGKKINTILQLRLHPEVKKLKEKLAKSEINKVYDVELTYIVSRGNWYNISWKGNSEKSGGVATNIGIHLFDMISWIFGEYKSTEIHISEKNTVSGYTIFEKARLKWFLSVENKYLPKEYKESNKNSCRSLIVDGEEFNFTNGFEDLHTESYRQIIGGNGFSLEEAGKAVKIAFDIRNKATIGINKNSHRICLDSKI